MPAATCSSHTATRTDSLTGFESKNAGFTGFAAGGTKTAWQSATAPNDRAIVVCESAIDALSHHQIDPDPATRYASTAGTPGTAQLALLDQLVARLPRGSRVVAGVDNDDAGARLSTQVQTIAARNGLDFARDSPLALKDWNEALQRKERDYILGLAPAVRALAHDRSRGR